MPYAWDMYRWSYSGCRRKSMMKLRDWLRTRTLGQESTKMAHQPSDTEDGTMHMNEWIWSCHIKLSMFVHSMVLRLQCSIYRSLFCVVNVNLNLVCKSSQPNLFLGIWISYLRETFDRFVKVAHQCSFDTTSMDTTGNFFFAVTVQKLSRIDYYYCLFLSLGVRAKGLIWNIKISLEKLSIVWSIVGKKEYVSLIKIA